MGHRLVRSLQSLARDSRGLTTVEYAIVLCLIAGVAVVTWDELGEFINEKVGDAHSTIDEAIDDPGY